MNYEIILQNSSTTKNNLWSWSETRKKRKIHVALHICTFIHAMRSDQQNNCNCIRSTTVVLYTYATRPPLCSMEDTAKMKSVIWCAVAVEEHLMYVAWRLLVSHFVFAVMMSISLKKPPLEVWCCWFQEHSSSKTGGSLLFGRFFGPRVQRLFPALMDTMKA